MDVEGLIGRMDVQPRPYQLRIVAKAVDLFRNKGMRSILIDSPTGSGKTVMGLLIARALQESLGLRVGWVAMRRYLLAQARAENETRRIGVEAEFLSMFDRDPPTGLDLLIVDEAQHDAAQSMAHLHQRIRPRFILGLSATPFRADRVKLCFDSRLKDAGMRRSSRTATSARITTTRSRNHTPGGGRRLLPARPRALGQDRCSISTRWSSAAPPTSCCGRPACVRRWSAATATARPSWRRSATAGSTC